MNDLHRDKLALLAEDEITMEALKQAVLERIHKPDIGNADDRLLGQRFRASEGARKLIEDVLVEIASYKEQKSNNKLNNKGR